MFNPMSESKADSWEKISLLEAHCLFMIMCVGDGGGIKFVIKGLMKLRTIENQGSTKLYSTLPNIEPATIHLYKDFELNMY